MGSPVQGRLRASVYRWVWWPLPAPDPLKIGPLEAFGTPISTVLPQRGTWAVGRELVHLQQGRTSSNSPARGSPAIRATKNGTSVTLAETTQAAVSTRTQSGSPSPFFPGGENLRVPALSNGEPGTRR